MLQALINVFKVAELRSKVLFTLGMLVVYRIGFWIPLPGLDQERLEEMLRQTQQGGGLFSRLADYVAIFSGGSLSQSTIFGLGIMPYISASIIFQLIASVSPALKKIQEEGPTGRQKIQEWTRYATIGLCVFQAFAWMSYLTSTELLYPGLSQNPLWWAMGVTALTAGTVFLMWLGEQIDRHGIGNGISMIIMAGILTGMPQAVSWVIGNFEPGGGTDKIGLLGLLALLGGFVVVVAGSIILTVAQRRIPIQQAKHTRGRRVYGGQRSYLPLRVNHGGVMPVIFASTLMIFPAILLGSISGAMTGTESVVARSVQWLSDQLHYGELPYVLGEVLLIYFFSYFWITVQFNPDDIAKQLREHGSFIPGLRPGPRTAEYLTIVMERITFVGAAFLAIIAVMPMLVNKALSIPFFVTQFLGGTGLLIVVSVCLDFVQRVEANLLMRNYAGFLGGGEESTGRRMRGPR